jgi:hypothetical protein
MVRRHDVGCRLSRCSSPWNWIYSMMCSCSPIVIMIEDSDWVVQNLVVVADWSNEFPSILALLVGNCWTLVISYLSYSLSQLLYFSYALWTIVQAWDLLLLFKRECFAAISSHISLPDDCCFLALPLCVFKMLDSHVVQLKSSGDRLTRSKLVSLALSDVFFWFNASFFFAVQVIMSSCWSDHNNWLWVVNVTLRSDELARSCH